MATQTLSSPQQKKCCSPCPFACFQNYLLIMKKYLFTLLASVGLLAPLIAYGAITPLETPDMETALTSAGSSFTALWTWFADWIWWIVGVLVFGAVVTLAMKLLSTVIHKD